MVKPGELQKVLQNLLVNGCPSGISRRSSRPLPTGPYSRDVSVLTEYVRNGFAAPSRTSTPSRTNTIACCIA